MKCDKVTFSWDSCTIIHLTILPFVAKWGWIYSQEFWSHLFSSFRMTKMPSTWLTWVTSWRSTSVGCAFYPESLHSTQWSATTAGLLSRRWRLWERDSTVRARYVEESSFKSLKSQTWLLHVSQWPQLQKPSMFSSFNPVLTWLLILLSSARRRSSSCSLWVWTPAGSSMLTPASRCLRSNTPRLTACRWWRLTATWSSWRLHDAMIVPSE